MQLIYESLKARGACSVGFVSVDALRPHMTGAMHSRQITHSHAAIALFPYYAGCQPGNIALFARAPDYIDTVKRLLDSVVTELAEHGINTAALKNSYPLPAADAAVISGAATVRGLHGLVITPDYGSFVAIGALLFSGTDCYEARPLRFCRPSDCGGACIKACPTGALRYSGGKRTFVRELCLSDITQNKKSVHTTLLRGAKSIWGCDLCQLACNKSPKLTTIPDFFDRLVPNLSPEDLDDRFSVRYAGYHFARHGPELLRRNMESIL